MPMESLPAILAWQNEAHIINPENKMIPLFIMAKLKDFDINEAVFKNSNDKFKFSVKIKFSFLKEKIINKLKKLV